MIKKGDVVWCWERTPDDFKFGGFLAIVSCNPSYGTVNVIKDTLTGPQQRTLLLRDVEKYCNKTDYEAEEIIIAVPTSIARIPCMGSNSRISAPKGAENIVMPPWSIWLRPWIRDKCSVGTIRDVEACMAGQ